MTHHVVRLQPPQIVASLAIGIAEAASGKNPQERLRHILPPERIPAHRPLVLLWCGEQLSSPDTIAVKGSNKSGKRFNLQVELRRFDGPLHMNVVTVPVVELDIGVLEPGRYEVSIEVTELWFSDLDHPERAAKPSMQRTSFSFQVV